MKLDIAKAFGRTFAFLFGHIVDVLRIAWLPIVLQLAAFFLLMPGYVRGTAGLAAAAGDPDAAAQAAAQALPAFGMFVLFLLATLATSVPMVVGLTRLTLNGEKPKTPFYIGWGNAETKVLAAWLIFAAMVAGLVIVLQIGSGVLLRSLLGPGPIATAIVLVINLVLLITIITICVRLSLLAPATVTTGKMSLRDSWERTDDDFWNFLGFWLLYGVAFLIIYLVLYFTVLLPPGYFASFQGMDPRDPDSMREGMRKASEVMLRSYDLNNMGNVVRLTVGAVIGPIGGIITSIAGASAWKLITESEQA